MDVNEGKEILTFPIIKKELLKNTLWFILRFGTAFLLLALIFWMIWNFSNKSAPYPTILITFGIIILLLFLIFIIKSTFLTYGILSERFTIKKAILYQKKELRKDHDAFVMSKLFFDRHGHYDIINHRYYVWSNLYCMLPQELFETSRIDDHFTLVVLGKKIIMVYNDKFLDTSSLQYSE